MHRARKNWTEELKKLVAENPSLPIIPMVCTDVVCGDDYNTWMGSVGSCYVDEYRAGEYPNDERVYTKGSDWDEILEDIADAESAIGEDMEDDEFDQHIESIAEKLEWTKAIIVYINTP